MFPRTDTDRDHDGNPDTATKPDRLDTLVALCTNVERSQLVEYTVTVDAPGTDVDRQFSGVADFLAPRNVGCENLFLEDNIGAKWPSGQYSVTVHATNGTDQASATGTVMITAK